MGHSSPLHSLEEEILEKKHEQLQEEDPQQNQEPQPHSQPQSPETQTLETPDLAVQEKPGQASVLNTSSDHQQLEQNHLPQHPTALDQENPDYPPEKQSGMALSSSPNLTIQPPFTDAVFSDPNASPIPLPSPANPHRRHNKRKKGKINVKKQQAIEKKLQTLMENLNPIPFVPTKTLDFSRHEKLLKRLGLWDFVHIEFDRSIRIDLIAQLIANYDPKLRCSYVNELRILVNRADLARSLKLPVKKEKGVNLMEGVDLDADAFSEEAIGFIEDLVSNYVLLHEDMWMMPGEVFNWIQTVKDGNPDKVDWAGLVWFMVEKELTQGEHLVDCYYASYLQYLIKSQREQLMKEETNMEMEVETKDEEVETKDEEDGDGNSKIREAIETLAEEKSVMEVPNIKLTLGQEEVEDEEMMDIKDSKEDEHEQLLLSGQDNEGEHFLQRCNLEDGDVLNSHERKEEGDEEEEEEIEEAEDGFDISPDDDAIQDDESTGNLLRGMEISFGSHENLHQQSSEDFIAARSESHTIPVGPSSLSGSDKRQFKHEYDFSHDSLNTGHKRVRFNGYSDNKPSDFGMCMDEVEQLMKKASMMYEVKEQACEQLRNSQQLLISELERQNNIINQLQKARFEELQRKDAEIFRLERELYVMGNLFEGYRKAIKETDKAFSEYRQRCQLPEEPIYKDAGPGGIMLSTAEIDKQRQKQEEENRLNCLILEQKFKEAEVGYISKFEEYVNKVNLLDERLMGLENGMKFLEGLSAGQKNPEKSECHE